MVKVVCDCCGLAVTRWLHVVTTPKAKEPWMNISDLICYGTERDMCEKCYNIFIERMLSDEELKED